MFKIKSYFTFQEVLDYIHELKGWEVPPYPNYGDVTSTWFFDLADHYDMIWRKICLDSSISTTFIYLVSSLIYDRHANDIILTKEKCILGMESPTIELTENDVKAVLAKILNVFTLTASKYVPLYLQYESASKNPIAPIKSTSKGETEFNDTPQNIGDWGDEDHTTNVSASKSETEVDVGTLMERLVSMEKYKSLALEWSNEFNQLFLKEEQVCL